MHEALRQLPSVNVLVDDPQLADATAHNGRDAVVVAIRAVLEDARQAIRTGGAAPSGQTLCEHIQARLKQRPALYKRVLNATGVILHTNLGRSPIADAAFEAMADAAGYCDLEMDLDTGKRASRLRGVKQPLCAVTGAQDGMVVNNNAASVLLSLAALAGTRPTAISRGHLVEIGGGFRLPTIMEASGSPLMEIGTTNRTHLKDYAEALEAGAGAVLIVHRSNFVMTGYVTEPAPEDIIALCRAHNVPVILDLGSGALIATPQHGLPEETTVPTAVKQGFDVVCFSGDKLLGGPQAGYLVGRADAVEKLRRHPLARAVRCDKVQLAGCVATLELYQRGEALNQVPIWRMLSEDTQGRAQKWHEAMGLGETAHIIEASGAVGGGSLPDGTVPGHALRLRTHDPQGLMRRLREQSPAIVGHIVDDAVHLHPRCMNPRDDNAVIAGVRAAIDSVGSPS